MMPLYCSNGHENQSTNRFCHACGEALAPREPGTIIGQVLNGHYQVMQELGRGGFGRTYLAKDSHRFDEFCVLKEFAPQVQGSENIQKAKELFDREAGVLYQLQHPQIPRFRELLRTEIQGNARLFLVQDYVEGQTYQTLLNARKNQGQVFTEAEVVQLMVQLLPVLTYLHGKGVVHRDISPDNLILRASDRLPVLIDFGGVKQLAAVVSQANQTGRSPALPAGVTLVGKVGYAPPEQMHTGEVFPHSDLHALAVTAIVLLTGQEPHVVFDAAQSWRKQVAIRPAFATVLERMLHPLPNQRYGSAQEALDALDRLGMGNSAPTTGTVATTPATPATSGSVTASVEAPSMATPAKRGFPWLGLLALLVPGLGLGGWWFSNRFRDRLPPSPPIVSPSVKPEPPKSPFSKEEQARKDKLAARRSQLGINEGFLNRLVNEAFFVAHPDRRNRPLTPKPEDDELRVLWDQLAFKFLERLETISADARSRMGSYSNADLARRQAAANERKLSSRALNDLTDVRFFALFPEQPRGENLLNREIGQVWQAIAEEQLKAIQNGTALEQISLSDDGKAPPIRQTLPPGSGKAYVVKLNAGNTAAIQLQAADRALRLSIYPPSSKQPALLKSSQDSQWSGTLPTTGFYEIVVVSDSAQPVNYELTVTAIPAAAPPSPTPESSPPTSDR